MPRRLGRKAVLTTDDGPQTVALLQMAAHATDLAANLAKGEALCRRAVSVSGYIELMGSVQV